MIKRQAGKQADSLQLEFRLRRQANDMRQNATQTRNNKLARLQVRFSLNNTLISDKSKLDTSRLIAQLIRSFVLLERGQSVAGCPIKEFRLGPTQISFQNFAASPPKFREIFARNLFSTGFRSSNRKSKFSRNFCKVGER